MKWQEEVKKKPAISHCWAIRTPSIPAIMPRRCWRHSRISIRDGIISSSSIVRSHQSLPHHRAAGFCDAVYLLCSTRDHGGEQVAETVSVQFPESRRFHEDCVNIIMNDLIQLMEPAYIEVWGKFLPVAAFPLTRTATTADREPSGNRWHGTD